MARTIYCDEEDGQVAAFLVSNLTTGEVVAVCDQHWPAWIMTLADAFAPGPSEVPAQEAQAAAEAAGEAGAAPAPPVPKRRRAGRQDASAELSSPASPFPDPAPVDG